MKLSISVSTGIQVTKVYKEEDRGHYIYRVEDWMVNGETTKMYSGYSKIDGSYIGNAEDADRLADKGITPQRNKATHKTASIGKSEDGKWYGWSHRAIYGFKPGDKYEGKKLKTEADCRRAACKFAESVSRSK